MRMDIGKVKTIGSGLIRPEGVMALDDGTLIAADARGGCNHIQPDGRIAFFGDLGGAPNGICIDTDGNVIVANIGNGQVQSLGRDGRHTVLMTHADSRRMVAPNFPLLDAKGRLWVTNSTENEDINAVLMRPTPDGSVVCIANGRPRIVADGIYFANGVALNSDATFLYVAQTMRSNILRFEIRKDGSLGPAEIFGPATLTHQGYPDGIAFDIAGNLWITFPQRNAVGYLTATGELCMYLEDPQRQVLQRPANICFGGSERRTAYIGSLDGSNIPYFEVPHAGLALVHQSI
ncbi:MAG: SMP-30/gluconolactonase/LRE family protein [Desulfatitalea sp.]|nr:SMP-30/gluconolactonase/LRE family protein [Desulfatitalea sp.]